VTFYTKAITKQLLLDDQKHNEQYETIEIKEFKQSHDLFMIVDYRDIYHFGASLKDLGKSGLPSLNSIREQLKCWVNWEI
jgi:hypothetical protein